MQVSSSVSCKLFSVDEEIASHSKLSVIPCMQCSSYHSLCEMRPFDLSSVIRRWNFAAVSLLSLDLIQEPYHFQKPCCIMKPVFPEAMGAISHVVSRSQCLQHSSISVSIPQIILVSDSLNAIHWKLLHIVLCTCRPLDQDRCCTWSKAKNHSCCQLGAASEDHLCLSLVVYHAIVRRMLSLATPLGAVLSNFHWSCDSFSKEQLVGRYVVGWKHDQGQAASL